MAIIVPPSKKVQALIIIAAAIFISVLAYRTDAEGQIADLFGTLSKKSNANLKVSTLDVVSSSSTVSNSDEKTGKNYVTQASLLSAQATTTPGEPNDPTNLSQQLSRNLFSNFMALQQSGGLTSDSQAQLVTDTISKISPPNIDAKYSIKDLRIVATTKDTMHTYGNDVARVLVSTAPKLVDQSNANALKIQAQMMTDLSNISVPGDFGLIHLQIINGMNVSNQMLSIMVNSDKDPVKALIAIKGVQDNEANMHALFTSIAATFKKNGIIFTSNEPGSIWNNY